MVKTPSQSLTIPPLENGDRLNRHEFERRYDAMSSLKKAELIEGTVYLAAALRFKSHGQPHGWMIGWLVTYEAMTLGVAVGDAPTVRLDMDNEPQPDAVLMILPEAGGQAQLSEDDYIEGAPELVIEIAASSVALDLHSKKQVYRRNGVKEYIVWQVLEQKISWFYLDKGEYVDLPVDSDSIIRSRIFPGLWLAVTAILAGNMQDVLAVLQEGLQSPEHAAFVHKLGL
ncbi:MAG: Uma2 family endonuclease [Symploca sp. SIO2E6]|nr:Uma2 family endonuclease [Symploca sp. SIO2E6]